MSFSVDFANNIKSKAIGNIKDFADSIAAQKKQQQKRILIGDYLNGQNAVPHTANAATAAFNLDE